MAEQCIVCLGDLRTSISEDELQTAAEGAASVASKGVTKKPTRTVTKSVHTDDETIAHLLPCKHDLHNACLKPWVERANSCPICRAKFNIVELSHTVGGATIDSYAVQDKVQEAELDPTMIVEDELYAIEAWEPCIICGVGDETHELMYCDGCDKAVHIFCAGFEEAPEVWYCESCLLDLEGDAALPGVASALRRRPQRTGRSPQRRGRRNNDMIWARVWQEVSRRLDLDLDFPFDDQPSDQRTPEQRREFRRWERRFEEANRQGVRHRLRDVAATRLQPSIPVLAVEPESQDELRAWNAFEKARESQEEPTSVTARKRKSTASPTSPQEPDHAQQPRLKRPRLRRPPAAEHPQQAESSALATQRLADKSTFLSSLLKDVESKPISASSPATSDYLTGQYSPRNSSPVRSPCSSGYITPRRSSVTPPVQHLPDSPSALPQSPATGGVFSPFSPTDFPQSFHPVNGFHHRGRRRDVRPTSKEEPVDQQTGVGRASSSSPSITLSYSAKEEIQRMVKLALGTRYRDKEISKEQYTDVNRDVSRKMYDLVGDASALTDQAERERWQSVAEEEVSKAVAELGIPDPIVE